MFGIFAPRYIKEGRLFLKNARKMLHYKRDLWSAKAVADFEQQLHLLESAIGARNQPLVEQAAHELDAIVGRFSPPSKDAAWRENCEVFLVAIIIAIGIRTYFLQPFTIPTGSMQPTLNGIIGQSTPNVPPPNPFTRVVDFLWHGRNYIDAVSKTDDMIVGVEEVKRFRFFTFTKIIGEKEAAPSGINRVGGTLGLGYFHRLPVGGDAARVIRVRLVFASAGRGSAEHDVAKEEDAVV